jgi:hypothetical protein
MSFVSSLFYDDDCQSDALNLSFLCSVLFPRAEFVIGLWSVMFART